MLFGGMRLRTLLTLLVLTTLIPLGVFAGLLIGRMWQQQRAIVEAQNVETARAISLAIDQEVEIGGNALRVAAALELLEPPDAASFDRLARRLLPVRRGWYAILLADAQGHVAFDSAGRGETAGKLGEGEWIRSVVATHSGAVSNLFIDSVAGGHFFFISVPVLDSGELKYVLAAQVRSETLSEILRRQNSSSDGVVSLLDRQPRLMARSRNEAEYIGIAPTESFRNAMGQGREGSVESRMLEGMRAYSSFSRSRLTGWTVGVGTPAEAVDAPIWRTMGELALVAVVLLAAGIASALILGRALVGALTSAAGTARGLARGEMPVPRHSRVFEAEELSKGLVEAGAILDVHMRERDQALLAEYAARREAEALSRSKDEFVATMSHELRTPLNAIYGWVKLLRSGKLDEERQEHALEVIERNTRAQTQLIEELLDMSRIVTGKLRLELRRVDLAAVLQGAVETLRPTATSKEIDLVLDLQAGVGPVSGDPERLSQIVSNLLTNSLKFTSKSGRVEVSLRKEGTDAVVRVTDDGIGISSELLPHIFERFRQGTSSPARKHGGLGIGLALVHHLVEMHGGAVSAASDGEGRGSCFTVRIPLMTPRLHAAESPTGDQSPQRDGGERKVLYGLKVLVVDDNEDARELAATTLRHAGAQVFTADSSNSAIESLQFAIPDVVLSDIAMPNGTGYDLARHIRLDARTAKVPAIALTAYARPEDRERALEAGFDTHIGKPVDPHALVRAVAAAVGKN